MRVAATVNDILSEVVDADAIAAAAAKGLLRVASAEAARLGKPQQ